MHPKVAVLLGCYNGAQYIREQLDSIEAQEYTDWCLYASDDGSTDGTLNILREYQLRWGKDKLVVKKGPRQGFAMNFLTLASDPSIVADYYAFCDQDDVWLPQKLAVAVACLREKDSSIPQAYGGRTIYTDITLKEFGRSRKFALPLSFSNAIVQSIAGANTIVFNHAAKLIVQKVGPVAVDSHDWWLYILVEGVGGQFHFDINPYILYRQHTQALVGGNTTIRGQLKRFLSLINGDYKKSNDRNIETLLKHSYLLTAQHAKTLKQFAKLRNSTLADRLGMLSRCSLYRQGWHGRISLIIAALLKKL